MPMATVCTRVGCAMAEMIVEIPVMNHYSCAMISVSQMDSDSVIFSVTLCNIAGDENRQNVDSDG